MVLPRVSIRYLVPVTKEPPAILSAKLFTVLLYISVKCVPTVKAAVFVHVSVIALCSFCVHINPVGLLGMPTGAGVLPPEPTSDTSPSAPCVSGSTT